MANDDDKNQGGNNLPFTPEWGRNRIKALHEAVLVQEDALVELLGESFNPLDIIYQENFSGRSPQSLIDDLLKRKSEDKYTYHFDLLAAAMNKQILALEHYELQTALIKDFVRVGQGAGQISQSAREDHDAIESLGFKIKDIHEKAVTGALKDEYTSETMIEHYKSISERFVTAARSIVAPELADVPRADLLDRIAGVRLDYAAMNIGHAGLMIGMVENLTGDLEQIQRFMAENVINDPQVVAQTKMSTYAFMREAHQSVKVQLDTAGHLIGSAVRIRDTGTYFPAVLNHTL